jgi:hypothetical protein
MYEREEIASEKLNESVIPIVMRFAACTLVIFIFTKFLSLLSRYDPNEFFQENGPIEWAQFCLLFGASVVFVVGSSVLTVFREICVLLASITAFAALRELDWLLDEVIPWIGWKIGFVFALYTMDLIYKNRYKFKWQIAQFLSSRSFVVLWASFVVAVPVAQLFAHFGQIGMLIRS